jgi:hypothetical protein
MDHDFPGIAQSKTKARSERYVGLHLSGAKNDKTVLCEIQYYPKYKQLVLSQIIEKIGPEEKKTGDSVLVQEINKLKSIKQLGINVSLQLPPCLRCRLKCPGVERCKVEEVQWLKKEYQKAKKKNKKARLAMPYTDRPVEYFVNQELEKHLEIQYSLSANAAPLTARAYFIQKHIKAKTKEILPALSVWRMGNYLNVQKSYLKYYKNSDDCEVVRLFFLDQLKEKVPIFMYNADKQLLVSNPHAFDAFICALSVFYDEKKMAEARPKNFPKKASWISFPKSDLDGFFES